MFKSKKGLLLVSAAVIFAQSTNAVAADLGTDAGVSINNTATVNYQVGGQAQTAVNSNTDTFVVDRKVNLLVDEVANLTTSVTINQTNAVTTFTVTNKTNATMDFSLAATQITGGTATHGGTDTFNANNVRVFVDSNANGSYDPLVDTRTYVDELLEDTSVTVFVVVDIPGTGLVNGSVAGVTLTATAALGGTANSLGANLTNDSGSANVAGTVQNVFADVAANGNAAGNGQASDDDDYTVTAPVLAVVKTSRVISDPISGTTNPKMVPGAVVEYCIAVTNSGTSFADNVNITDNVPANTTYVAGTAFVATVSGGVCTATATAGSHNGGTPGIVSGSLGTINAGATSALRFQVTIN